MAAYPSYAIGLRSRIEPENGYQDDFDDTGGHHSRVFHDVQYYRMELTHPGLTLAQFNTLMAFYEAGPRTAHTLTYFDESPTVTYSVKFLAPPEIVANHGNGRFDVEVMLRGSKT